MQAGSAEAPGAPETAPAPGTIPVQVIAAAILISLALLIGTAAGAVVHLKGSARPDSIWFGAALVGVLFNGLIIFFVARAHNWARVIFLITLILGLLISVTKYPALAASKFLLLTTGIVYLCQFAALSLLVSTPGCAAFARSGRLGAQNQDHSPTVACLLAAITSGLGLLYVGRLRAALALPVIPLAIFFLARLTGLILMPWGLVTFYALLIALWLGVIVWCGVLAKRSNDVRESSPRWYIYLAYLVGLLTFVFLVLRFHNWLGANMYVIPSDSMSDTIDRGDFVIADTWAYWAHRPQRGDVIVFRLPKTPSVSYIKRIVGLPGDHIEDREGRIYVDGRELNEPYVRADNDTNTSYQNWQQIVPADSYFVLGDDRDNSMDSREYGAVPIRYISSRARAIWLSADPRSGLSFSRIGYVK